MIIALSGKAGTGKTTLAIKLANMLGGRVISYADPLRAEVAEHFNIPVETLKDSHAKTNMKVRVGQREMTIRALLQWWGTDIRRRADDDYWTDQLMESISDDETVIIDDARFPNEIDCVGDHNLRMRIEPYPGWEPVADQHPSETALDDYKGFDGHIYPEFGDDSLDTAAELIAKQVRLNWRV